MKRLVSMHGAGVKQDIFKKLFIERWINIHPKRFQYLLNCAND